FLGDARGLRAKKRLAAPVYVVVREYAHQVRANRQPGDRVDFTETLFWNAGVKTDPKTGEATIKFGLSDSVTSFRVLADAFDSNGTLGQGSGVVESVEPFYLEPKLPLEATAGDVIQLPLGIVNATQKRLSAATLRFQAKGLGNVDLSGFDLAADARIRKLVEINVGDFTGETEIVISGSAGPHADRVTRKLTVRPQGFPQEIGRSGMLFADETRKHEIIIPAQLIPGSLSASASVFPTPLASMTAALERLIREPSGCFEQTSSTTYPLVMAQQYFQTHSGVDPDLIRRSNENLEKGYKRLIGYECKQGGYEWFGADPGHEALTAYGLLEFSDMAEVFPVDSEMVSRSRKWLLGRRDGQGGFTRKRRALHTWITDKDVSNAYITWALLSAGETGLDAEVKSLKLAAAASKNSYVVALAANVMTLAGDKKAANSLMDRLVKLQAGDGSVGGATQSIVGSRGSSLAIETTSLATLAWLSDRDYIDFADKGVRYLAEACKAGRFGSTQSTVLALRAIVAFDKADARPKAPGSVQLIVDGKPVGKPVKFDEQTQGVIQLPDSSKLLTPGKHVVAVKMSGGSSMPHAITINLNTLKPSSSLECPLRLTVSLK
ncbi:MAG: hypothetical protein N2C14_27455, partial [Planctomycetales bacterium]